MRAAIYARRSTEEHQASSLEVQVDEARRFIESKGWTLDPEHVFIDNGVSRAEFKKRPALIRMLYLASSKARPFDIVVCRDETRLGGDTFLTGQLIGDLHSRGVQLWYHFTNERVTLDGATDKFMVAARNFASELEREKISQRTRENHQHKARTGKVPGNPPYGFGTAPSPDGSGKVYVINPEQAAIVGEVFARYAKGDGLRTIARDLNLRGIRSPRGAGWKKTGIHDMIRNEKYRGVFEWGERRKGYADGTKVRTLTEQNTRTRTERPDLAIVDPTLWELVAAQIAAGKRAVAEKGRGSHTPERSGTQAKNLLSNTMRCGCCGGPLIVFNGRAGMTNRKVYGCANYKNGLGGFSEFDAETKTTTARRGCANSLTRSVEEVNARVIAWVNEHVLKEELVQDVLADIRVRVADQSEQNATEVPGLHAEAAKLERQIKNLVNSLADATPETHRDIHAGIRERRDRLTAIENTLQGRAASEGAIDFELRRHQAEAGKRVARLRALLADGDPKLARDVMGAIFGEGGITVFPIELDGGKRFSLVADASLMGALALEGTDEGDSSVPLGVSVPSGIRSRTIRKNCGN